MQSIAFFTVGVGYVGTLVPQWQWFPIHGITARWKIRSSSLLLSVMLSEKIQCNSTRGQELDM
jgi:hypothetical protein